jgi:hypothetical protein
MNLLSAIAGPGGLDSLMARYGPLIQQYSGEIQKFAEEHAALIQQYVQQCAGLMRSLQELPDPLHSSVVQLLQRPDVQNHLGLNLKQKSELADLLARGEAKTQMFWQSQQAESRQSQQADSREMSDEERQAAQQQLRQRAEQFRTGLQGDLDKAIQTILKPEQLKRIGELDLQWRCPLALADPKVAEPVKLTAEEQSSVQTSLSDFQSAAQRAQMKAMLGLNIRAFFPGGGGARDLPTPEQLQEKLLAYRKELDKARKSATDAVLTSLTPEHKSRWQEMTGAPFTFRKYD